MSNQMKRVILPFTAIVGQLKLKQALVLNAINPSLLGVLVRGEKGTGKSTAVRALADLLPEIEVVRCPFNCGPNDASLRCATCNDSYMLGEGLPTMTRKIKVVELPLGATEDRVTGTLDIGKALREGIKALEPGILAEVNQGILYIDEVNLLDDHLVDILLDSAAMGVNTVEREGISVAHPSKFILVGTMNPEEGEIRPQLLDRFGLSVDIKGTKDAEERIEIIRVVEGFEKAPESFSKRYEKGQEELRQRILKARELLKEVEMAEDLLKTIAAICLEFEVHGHRADFLIARAGKTIAAYNQRKNVIGEDVREAAELVLPHRMRRMPFEEPKPVTERVEAIIRQRKTPALESENSEQGNSESGGPDEDEEGDSHAQIDEGLRRLKKSFEMGAQKKAEIKVSKDKKRRVGSGRRARTLSSHSGKYVKAKLPEGKTTDIAIDATIRASVARKGDLKIEEEDLREKVRAKKISSVIVFVVDASGSMAAIRGMEMAKRAIMALLEDSYQKRDKVSFIAVAGDKADVLLPPTSSVELAVRYLRELPTGGRTPLPDGLYKGLQVLRTQLWKNRNIIPIMVLVSDGRGNVPIGTDVKKELVSLAKEIKKQGINLVVIDSDDGFLNLGYNKEIVEASGGQYYRLDELDSGKVVNVVKALRTLGENASPPIKPSL
ncbi:MAG: VWA domain-containing protein [Dehalococcoidia bacterium]|nr:MAG: VWA domain-containing protein [Dehalococcoidia bacterium]